ncbi:helix-turn-helix domain-containing protein [Elstera cyanobacteriorum]|uniref:helix-turn-helix domain-containing protein n=1 Tax=Elstera cyanobacteriorum TaxID=2022747 RepID=UPI002352C166|nr:helix-turn-helix domain-containing protein [Elstera cyanobacteriorum]MCK6442307.1 helix-turn-helix domain-containing protein [Elstera cyanobacteriorum]
MKLHDYLQSVGKSETEFAREIGVSQSCANRWCRGQRIPPPHLMKRIVRVTAGQVMPNDFYRLDQDTAA